MCMAGRFCTHSRLCEFHCLSFVHACKADPLSSLGMEFAKIVVGHIKQVVPRSSIRGFKDDYHYLDADVVVLSGETHIGTKAVNSCPILMRSQY